MNTLALPTDPIRVLLWWMLRALGRPEARLFYWCQVGIAVVLYGGALLVLWRMTK